VSAQWHLFFVQMINVLTHTQGGFLNVGVPTIGLIMLLLYADCIMKLD
jgi:hypothetical protein